MATTPMQMRTGSKNTSSAKRPAVGGGLWRRRQPGTPRPAAPRGRAAQTAAEAAATDATLGLASRAHLLCGRPIDHSPARAHPRELEYRLGYLGLLGWRVYPLRPGRSQLGRIGRGRALHRIPHGALLQGPPAHWRRSARASGLLQRIARRRHVPQIGCSLALLSKPPCSAPPSP